MEQGPDDLQWCQGFDRCPYQLRTQSSRSRRRIGRRAGGGKIFEVKMGPKLQEPNGTLYLGYHPAILNLVKKDVHDHM